MGACSVGGGYSWDGGGFGAHGKTAYGGGHYAAPQAGHYGSAYSGYTSVGHGNACGAPVAPPVIYPPVVQPPLIHPSPCAVPAPQPPVYTPAPTPCAVDPCASGYPVNHQAHVQGGYGYSDPAYHAGTTSSGWYEPGYASGYSGPAYPASGNVHYFQGPVPQRGLPFGFGPGRSVFGHYGQDKSGRNRRGPLELFQPNSGYKYGTFGLAEYQN
ncbi:MAG: hypothetical protein WBA35_04140, partial [Litorimonas sp.]